jgi:hypothetical protein
VWKRRNVRDFAVLGQDSTFGWRLPATVAGNVSLRRANMAIFRASAPNRTFVLVALLAAATLLSPTSSTHAQYYYVPSQDYYRNDTAEGTVLGGALGAITGAVVGGKKKRGEGALIGAGVGALTGNVLGRSKDQADESRAAAGAAAVAQANQYATAQAVTNYDLIRMTQAGVSDDVIIGSIRARGARLDLSPQGIISLKESGVSDAVLVAAQQLIQAGSNPPPPPRTTIVTEPAPPAVIVRPYPYRMYYPAPRPHYHPRGARMHYQFRF